MSTPEYVDRFTGKTSVEIMGEFFLEVDRWVKELPEPGVAWCHKWLDICSRKPKGAKHDSNLLRSEDGRVWDHSFRWVAQDGNLYHHTVNVLVEQVRPAGTLAEYKPGEILEIKEEVIRGGRVQSVNGMALVRSSGEEAEADWGWTHPDPYGNGGSAGYAASSLVTNLRGLAFAKKVHEQRGAIEAWFLVRSKSTNRVTRDAMEQDVKVFYSIFAPEFDQGHDIPDPSGLHCMIRLVLDRLAGFKGRTYMC